MSAVRLLVLGACRRQGRIHGYAVHRELAEWRVETWTNVRPGSIYHALKQLTADGKLRVVGDEPGSGGPARTVYELTEAGETKFFTLLEGALSSFALVEFSAGVAFMDALPRQRAIDLLRATHERLASNADGLRTLSGHHPDRTPAPHTRDLLDLWSGSLDAMATWIEGSLERLEDGEYVMAGESHDASMATAPPTPWWTDSRVGARPSPLGGHGAFATERIGAGETVQVIGGTLMSTRRMQAEMEAWSATGRYLDAAQVDDDLHLVDIDSSLEVPMNHSCDPNCWMADAKTVVARRDIEPGEELTVDYALQTAQPVDLLDEPCRCGSPLCRGRVTGDDWRLPQLQQRYRGHFAPFIERRIAASSPSSSRG